MIVSGTSSREVCQILLLVLYLPLAGHRSGLSNIEMQPMKLLQTKSCDIYQILMGSTVMSYANSRNDRKILLPVLWVSFAELVIGGL